MCEDRHMKKHYNSQEVGKDETRCVATLRKCQRELDHVPMQDTSNDDLIVDCCLYLQKVKHHLVLAISQDHNFCSTAEAQGGSDGYEE